MSDAGHTAPLSYAQHRVWQRTQADPTTLSYNLPIAFRLRGWLQVDALERAFGAVVARHEALRTVFRTVGGDVRQVVLPERGLRMARHVATGDAESFVRERLADDANRPFSLEDGPLLRVGVIEVAQDEHVLFLAVHHIVSDGWSADVLFEEVSAIYDALVGGTEPVLPPAHPFREYALHQEAWMQSEDRDKQLGYWSRRLRGANPLLDLPAVSGAPRAERHPTRQSFAIAHDLSEAVRVVARLHRVTPFVVMLAAFKALLWRYTGCEDISVGSWVAGRRRAEWERMIGLVRNAVVIRTTIGGADSCGSVIARVADAVFEAFEHQDVPLEQVLSAVAGPGMDAWRSRLIWFSGGRWRLLALSGIEATFLHTAPATAGRYLSIGLNQRVGRRADRWAGSVDFSPLLIDAVSVTHLIEDFQRVLAQMCHRPASTLADLVVPRSDRHAHALQ